MDIGERGALATARRLDVLNRKLLEQQVRLTSLQAVAARPIAAAAVAAPAAAAAAAAGIPAPAAAAAAANAASFTKQIVAQQTAIAVTQASVVTLGTAFSGVNTPFRRFRRNLSTLPRLFRRARGSTLALAAAITAGVGVALAKASISFAKLGGSVLVAKQQFEFTSKAMSEQANVFLPKLREATLGTISDFELMRLANFALASGLDVTGDQFTQLASGAVKLAKVTGRDATEALQRLTFGIVKQERRILDELTIIVRANDIFGDFAKANNLVTKELTAQQKLQAFLDATLKATNERVATFTDVNFEAATAGERASAQFENLKNRIAELFVTSGAAEGILSILGNTLDRIGKFFEDPTRVANFFGLIQSFVQGALTIMLQLLRVLEILSPILQALAKVAQFTFGVIGGALEIVGIPFRAAGAAISGFSEGAAEAVGEGFATMGQRDREGKATMRHIIQNQIGPEPVTFT